MTKTNAKKPAAPAKKTDVKKYLPLIVLLIGLIIMTVCFINVNSRLSDAATQLAQTQAALETANAQLAALSQEPAEPTIVVDNTAVAEVARLQAELDVANTALTEKTTALEAAEASVNAIQAELDAANAALTEAEATIATKQAEVDTSAIIIAHQQAQLDDAADALEAALEAMNALIAQ